MPAVHGRGSPTPLKPDLSIGGFVFEVVRGVREAACTSSCPPPHPPPPESNNAAKERWAAMDYDMT